MNRSTDSENIVHQALHLTRDDGTLSKAFNPRTGKWETESSQPSGKQELAFDPQTGKLIVKHTNVDSALAIPMAAAGFFIVRRSCSSGDYVTSLN